MTKSEEQWEQWDFPPGEERLEEVTSMQVTMNREIAALTDIIFQTLLDTIPCLRNTGDPVNEAILRIYERSAAFFQDMDEEILIEHPEVNNVEG